MSLVLGPAALPFRHGRVRITVEGIELDGQPFPEAWVDRAEVVVRRRKTALMARAKVGSAVLAGLFGAGAIAMLAMEGSRGGWLGLLGFATAAMLMLHRCLAWWDESQARCDVWLITGGTRRELLRGATLTMGQRCGAALEQALGPDRVQVREVLREGVLEG